MIAQFSEHEATTSDDALPTGGLSSGVFLRAGGKAVHPAESDEPKGLSIWGRLVYNCEEERNCMTILS